MRFILILAIILVSFLTSILGSVLLVARADVFFLPGDSNTGWTPVIREFDGVEMVMVPAGCFLMGSDVYGYERPIHGVCMRDFWIMRTEVTNAMYRRCVDQGGCTPPQNATYYDDPAYADHPVVYVDWQQASDFAAWIGGSLPTEAQWEFAGRGPEGLVYPWGDDFVADQVVYGINSGGQTAKVGSKPGGASWVGALDMSGNVWEWVADWYNYDTYQSESMAGKVSLEPAGPGVGSRRSSRGGGFRADVDSLRIAKRGCFNPEGSFSVQGFRVSWLVPE
jgi:formylglycine-generating enzyme required for sulfatase activity